MWKYVFGLNDFFKIKNKITIIYEFQFVIERST